MALLQVSREMEGRAVECRATNSAGTAASAAAVIRIKCRSTAGYQVYQHTAGALQLQSLLNACLLVYAQNQRGNTFCSICRPNAQDVQCSIYSFYRS